MSSLIHFESQVHLDKAHCYLDGIDNRSQKLALLGKGIPEVKAHEQIIYGSISHLMKLPEVRQV